jgi:hypothetical protein
MAPFHCKSQTPTSIRMHTWYYYAFSAVAICQSCPLNSKAIMKKRGNPPLIPTPQRWLHFIANHNRQHHFECKLDVTTLFPQTQSVSIDRSVLPRGPTDDIKSVSRGLRHTNARHWGQRLAAMDIWTKWRTLWDSRSKTLANPGKKPTKKVAEARLEPWSIIFCSIPHLVQKLRKKSDGLLIIKNQNESGKHMYPLSRSEVTYRKC